ncbi:MAG: hypothetical protein C5B54_06985, partial [Acidobacteria bacterium]
MVLCLLAIILFCSISPNAFPATPDAKTVFCQTLPSTTTPCKATTGSNGILIKGQILTTNSIYQGGEVLIDGTGLIRYVGCSKNRPQSLNPLASSASSIECSNGVVSAGLINSHDHLSFDQNFPLADNGIRYEHRNDWRSTMQIADDESQSAILWSEMRQAITGTTSIAGAAGTVGF